MPGGGQHVEHRGDVAGESLAAGGQGDRPVRAGAQQRGAGGVFEVPASRSASWPEPWQTPRPASRRYSHRQVPCAAPGPEDTARTLHQLITELTTLATTATVTKRVTFRRAPAGTTQTSPLFDESGTHRK